LYPIINKNNKKIPQILQNKALRIIFKKKYDCSTSILDELARKHNLESIETRAFDLTSRYISNCLLSGNEIVRDLISEFKLHKSAIKIPNYNTLLDKFI
jgi:hypothetical protein